MVDKLDPVESERLRDRSKHFVPVKKGRNETFPKLRRMFLRTSCYTSFISVESISFYHLIILFPFPISDLVSIEYLSWNSKDYCFVSLCLTCLLWWWTVWIKTTIVLRVYSIIYIFVYLLNFLVQWTVDLSYRDFFVLSIYEQNGIKSLISMFFLLEKFSDFQCWKRVDHSKN